jgi:hypothetical protein
MYALLYANVQLIKRTEVGEHKNLIMVQRRSKPKFGVCLDENICVTEEFWIFSSVVLHQTSIYTMDRGK